jgi:hypothetical protein
VWDRYRRGAGEKIDRKAEASTVEDLKGRLTASEQVRGSDV